MCVKNTGIENIVARKILFEIGKYKFTKKAITIGINSSQTRKGNNDVTGNLLPSFAIKLKKTGKLKIKYPNTGIIAMSQNL